jgi:hypothetical protein
MRTGKGQRLKVYASTLDKNYYLINPSGRPLSPALILCLAQNKIAIGWKRGASIFPDDVTYLELGLKVLLG